MVAAGHTPILGVLFHACVWHARQTMISRSPERLRAVEAP
jgi:hypothetical protein